MEYYPYALQFPFSKTILNFRELNNLEYAAIVKINSTLPPVPEYRMDYFDNLIEILEKSLKDSKKIQDLNIIEFLMYALRLRSVSVGSFIEFASNTDTYTEEKTKKVKLDINNLLKNIYEIGQTLYEYENIIGENASIKLMWPNINSEQVFLNLISKNDTEKFLFTLQEFIDCIIIKDQVFDFKLFNKQQKEELFGLLPISVKNLIQTNLLSLLKDISNKPLFEIEQFNNYNFEFYNGTLQDIIRFIFANDENNLMMENIFMVNKGFTLNDINSISPISKQNYINYIIEQHNNSQSVQ